MEVALSGGAYQVVQQCSLDFNLSGGDSGLSAIRFHTSPQGARRSVLPAAATGCAASWGNSVPALDRQRPQPHLEYLVGSANMRSPAGSLLPQSPGVMWYDYQGYKTGW